MEDQDVQEAQLPLREQGVSLVHSYRHDAAGADPAN